MRNFWIFALAGGISACELSPADPLTAYLGFYKAAQGRNPQAAFEALSSASRQILRQHSREISVASGGAIRDDPIPLVFVPGFHPIEPAKPKIARLAGDTAWLTVEVGGHSSEVKLILEERKWKVDLTPWLADAT